MRKIFKLENSVIFWDIFTEILNTANMSKNEFCLKLAETKKCTIRTAWSSLHNWRRRRGNPNYQSLTAFSKVTDYALLLIPNEIMSYLDKLQEDNNCTIEQAIKHVVDASCTQKETLTKDPTQTVKPVKSTKGKILDDRTLTPQRYSS